MHVGTSQLEWQEKPDDLEWHKTTRRGVREIGENVRNWGLRFIYIDANAVMGGQLIDGKLTLHNRAVHWEISSLIAPRPHRLIIRSQFSLRMAEHDLC